MEPYPKILLPHTLLRYWTKCYEEIRNHPPSHIERAQWEKDVDKLVDRMVVDDLQIEYQRLEGIKAMLRQSNKAQAYRFITISYPKSLKPDEFVKKVRKWQDTKWKWGTSRIQRFEFNGKEGYHPHIHMLIFTEKKKSQIIKELSSKTKLDSNFIDVLTGRFTDHMNYIKGIKQESKQQQMELDSTARLSLGIQEYEEYPI